MDDLDTLAGEVADRMLGGGSNNRSSRLFGDLREMAVQALRKTRSGELKRTSGEPKGMDLARQRRSTPVGDIRGLWRVHSY